MKAQLTQSHKYAHRTAIGFVFFVVIGILVMHSASALARGYASDDPQLLPGMVASLSEDSTSDKPKVERAERASDNPVIGIAVALGSDLVTAVSAPDQVYVQSSGEAEVYATDLNGDIKNGDKLEMSPLRGVLMKAGGENVGPVIAVTLEGLDQQSAETRSVQTNSGTKEVRLAKLKVNLDNKAFASPQVSAGNSSLQQLGEVITGREVSEARIIAGIAVFVLVMIAEGAIIYGAISSSITALGRNPLAKKLISKEALRVLLVAMGVLALGVMAIYAVLWF